MTFTEGGQEWVEVTSHEDLANARRVFVPGMKIEPDPLAELRERCFELAESWTDDGEVRHPQHFAYELKRILT